jgi:hypothetical protein
VSARVDVKLGPPYDGHPHTHTLSLSLEGNVQ